MNQSPARQNQPATARGGLAVLILLALFLGGLGLYWSWTADKSEDSGPAITTQATDLSPETRSQLEADLQARIYGLDQVESQIQALEAQPVPGRAVPPERIKEIARTLADLQTQLSNPNLDGAQLRHARLELDELYRERLRSVRDFLLDPEGGSALPSLPPLDVKLLSRLTGAPLSDDYRRQYLQLQRHLERIRSAREESFAADLSGRSDRLMSVTTLRYQVLLRLIRMGSFPLVEDPAGWMKDVGLELRMYPVRKWGIVRLALNQLQQRTGGGTAWVFALLFQIGYFLLNLLVLLAFVLLAQRRGNDKPGVVGALAWLLVWPVALFAGQSLMFGVADALRPIPLVTGSYALYRAYLQLAEGPVLEVLANSLVGRQLGMRTRMQQTLRRIGRVFLAQAVVNTLVLTLAGPGLLLAASTTGWQGLLILLYFALTWSWRRELGQSLAHLLPISLGEMLSQLCSSALLGVFLAPLALPLVGLLGLLHSAARWSARFEWGKRLTSGVLRHWVESSQDPEAQSLHPLPADYRERFLDAPVGPQVGWDLSVPRFRAVIETSLGDWRLGQGGESSMVLHGPNGSGRHGLVRYLVSTYSEQLQVVQIGFAGRILTDEDVLAALASAFQLEPCKDLEALAQQLDGRPGTLAIVPEAHRLFLATVGGFRALRLLHRVMARCRQRIFWCLVMPTQSFTYLRLVAGEGAAMPVAVRLPRWSAPALAAVLLARHQHTGVSFRFSAAVRRAAEAQPGATAESHFFEVMTDMCQGNPTVARELWLASARVDQEGQVVIGLPPLNPAGRLDGLPGLVAYLLSAMVRHGDLTFSEALRATGLSEGNLYVAWERCLEVGIFQSLTPGRVSLARLWLGDIGNYLKERNLLDGE